MDHVAHRIVRPGISLSGAVALALGALVAPILLATSGVSGAAAHASTTVTAPNTMYVLNDTGSSLSSFAPGATGNTAPTSTVSGPTSTLNSPFYMAMDQAGNVWVANNGSSTVIEFTQAELATGGSPNPAVVLATNATSSIDHPTSLTFDRSGDLWVVNAGLTESLVEFTPSQLAASGTPTPAVTITGSGLSGPGSLAIDASGNAWVGNHTSNTIVSFARAQLNTSGTPTPVVTLSAAAGSISNPDSLAFDRSGRLWVANNVTPGTVVAFTPAQLASTGAPVPSVTLTSDGTSIHNPDGLTFDPFGNLWVANILGNSVAEFSPAQQAVSGSPTAVSSLAGANTNLSGPDNVLFVPSTGYTLAASDGGIFNYGGSGFFGSTGSLHLNSPIVGMAESPDGLGYWLVAGDGGIFNFGDALFHGSAGSIKLNKPVVGMAATPDGGGYWLVASDGGIFTYGDAKFFGGHGGSPLNQPVVGMAATADGGGYWLVASDGGIFTYGDAVFSGSHGGSPLNKPIVGMAATQDGGGYWLVASDGGIFNYGNATFYGAAGSIKLNQPIVGMAPTPDGGGYWLVATDGGVFTYGNAPFFGSAGSIVLNKPIVGMAGPYG